MKSTFEELISAYDIKVIKVNGVNILCFAEHLALNSFDRDYVSNHNEEIINYILNKTK